MHAHDHGERERGRHPVRRVPADEPVRRGPEEVLELQRALGNEATSRLVARGREGLPVQRASPDTAAREEMQSRMRERDAALGVTGPPNMAETSESVPVEGTGLTYDEVIILCDLMGVDARAEPVARPAPRFAPPDRDALRDERGMPVENQEWFQEFADTMGLSIYVRPTNPASTGWLRGLAVPKPQKIKAKTINKLDVELGAAATNVGLVGHFRPRQPVRGDGMTDARWNELVKRHEDRAEQFALLEKPIEALEAEGTVAVHNGVLGYRKGTGGKFWPITGDHDVFDIRHAVGGDTAPDQDQPIREPKLSEEAYQASVRLMTKADKGVMHGAHMRWERGSPEDEKMFDKIVTGHLRGGEPLICFSPHRPPQLVWAPDR
ncbi:hypothetical protein Q5530_30325 [Saccharothrix sp. BKS2]|uniref:hypothetical protein n=1 Tax=Saccharothrix sp. BKS2 TaxID=3064400 RepID=UPI0039EC5D4F